MSLPTSVLVALLAAAWLFVLVPMFARRREAVPEAYESTARFRVLQSDGSAKRRRPHFGRRSRYDDDELLEDEYEAADPADLGELDEELLDGEDADDAYELDAEGDEYDEDDEDQAVAEYAGGYEYDSAGYERAEYAPAGDDSAGYDSVGEDDYDEPKVRQPVAARRSVRAAASAAGYQAADNYQASSYDAYDPADDYVEPGADHYSASEDDELDDDFESRYRHPALAAAAGHRRDPSGYRHEPTHPDLRAEPAARVPAGTRLLDPDEAPEFEDAGPELAEDPRYRPIPRRSGRGGFNPEAAERRRAQRYRRRRRVFLTLFLLALISGLVAHFLRIPEAWGATGLFGVLLVLYMVYLRRQVKVEADIRRRRMAKLQRARQVRPEFQPGRRTPNYEFDDDAPTTQLAPVTSGMPSRVPPQHRQWLPGRTVVDLDDEDPSFDDLESYRPMSYRRAAGQ